MPHVMTIDGRPVQGAHRLRVEDPALGKAFDEAPDCSPAELDTAVAAAEVASRQWAGLSEAARRQALLACGTLLSQHSKEIALLLTREQGKPYRAAAAEVGLAADWFRQTAQLTLVPGEVVAAGERSEVRIDRIPHGVVAAISPSNFPIILAVTKLAPALLAGNTVVLKPSPLTPLSTLRMGEILSDALPPGVLDVISGGGDLGRRLTTHPGVRMISFTGSVATGRAIARDAAGTFKRVVLELGGNDAAIVLPDQDVGEIAEALFGRAMENSGQFCAAVKRVYVARHQQDELAEALAKLARGTRLGNGLDPETDLGPLVSAEQLDWVSTLVREAEEAGARVVAGGAPVPGVGHFYPPTIVTGLPAGTRLETEEQFGPVLPVLAYDSVDEAITRANATEFGLGGSVWGEESAARKVAAELDCGTSWVNTHGALRGDAPFGGYRTSGVGVEYGYWGLLEYTRLKVLNVAR
ncbi:aldehyde dehydrogenase family protein [Amycolatopsis sp. H20-H5]|uniref:aldehyde dehydrogenase family protein n=1 Tax=Amycolatopsis sp. H20-H5 TaxID=3046309 RepID=UPI002DBDE3D2|nr:aldehyde dehydrogenase family protein [Amycolatopsis sp. H20-H5]MEC3976917.1 aldehyde dehydrogenase family protein [Amycolatopsis sp. H20-H5]